VNDALFIARRIMSVSRRCAGPRRVAVSGIDPTGNRQWAERIRAALAAEGFETMLDDLDEAAPALPASRARRIDVAITSGAFALRDRIRARFDFSIWVDCSFETALERARDAQSGPIAQAAAERHFRESFWPAMGVHLRDDDPISATQITVRNDPRLPSMRKRVVVGACA
jgi:hypothetical protein